MLKTRNYRGGFALPTVLIASVVMLIVLSVSVSSVAAVRTTLKTQYYEQLAKAAGEAGVAYAKACLAKNGNKPLWTDEKPLRPSTDCAGNPQLNPEVQVLVVAGGGGGGHNQGGGGGGGGVVENTSFTVSGGQTYTVVVGAGGNGGSSGGAAGAKGGNSSFASIITAQGGGGGGGRVATNSVTQATTGGSGGGGAGTVDAATSVPAAGAVGTAGQGFAGGNGSSGPVGGNGGGGGGAGSAGGVADGADSGLGVSGDGGNGYFSDISGEVFYYGGGGSGGRWGMGSVGLPGVSGGGKGGENNSVAGIAGLANSGGGGGGGGSSAAGGKGGSGVVYVRYANNGTINAAGGSDAPYTSGPYKIHAFKNTGSSTFSVSSATSSVCPSDPRCSVLVNDTLRSSFSVPRPVLDVNGQALTIANTGYVELLRTSSGAVWRTYRQPAVQVAAVPDFCSGAATSSLGWQNAVVTSAQESIPNASGARTISLGNGNLPAGKIFFRKDFTVVEAGAYNLSLLTTDSTVLAESYVDGAQVSSSQGGLSNGAVNLSVGCHTITVQVTNKTLTPTPARFTAAISKNGSAPIVSTDSSWRASAGNAVHFSQSDYYVDPAVWGKAVNYSTPSAHMASAVWSGLTGDPFAQMIAPPGSGCPGSCPGNSTGYLRDSQDIYVATETTAQVSALCDNDCAVFMDGQMVLSSSPWSSVNQQTFTITPGYHRFGVRLYNGDSAVNPAAVGVSVVDRNNGTVLTRTDLSWQGATSWTSGQNTAAANIQSYENSFRPSPSEIPEPKTFDFLAVGGGGGGGTNSSGGGGAGGVIAMYDAPATIGTFNISIGGGGAGAASHLVNGAKGGNTTFGSYTALGGGYGASRDGGAAATSGGSGGGGAGATAQLRVPGASGTAGQGSAGGNGITADAGVNATGGGGGGAGGPGIPAVSGGQAGHGGPGYVTYMTGSRLAVGGGGGGSITVNGTLGQSTDGGGNGTSAAAANAAPNTGGGGGGRSNTNPAGSGASGIVVIRVKTGSMNVSVTGAPQVSSVTIDGTAYTVYTFKASGSFRIISFN